MWSKTIVAIYFFLVWLGSVCNFYTTGVVPRRRFIGLPTVPFGTHHYCQPVQLEYHILKEDHTNGIFTKCELKNCKTLDEIMKSEPLSQYSEVWIAKDEAWEYDTYHRNSASVCEDARPMTICSPEYCGQIKFYADEIENLIDTNVKMECLRENGVSYSGSKPSIEAEQTFRSCSEGPHLSRYLNSVIMAKDWFPTVDEQAIQNAICKCDEMSEEYRLPDWWYYNLTSAAELIYRRNCEIIPLKAYCESGWDACENKPFEKSRCRIPDGRGVLRKISDLFVNSIKNLLG